jgi:hypothetical protein
MTDTNPEPSDEELRRMGHAAYDGGDEDADPIERCENERRALFNAGRAFERSQQAERSPHPVMTSAPGEGAVGPGAKLLAIAAAASTVVDHSDPWFPAGAGMRELVAAVHDYRGTRPKDKADGPVRIPPPGDGTKGTK